MAVIDRALEQPDPITSVDDETIVPDLVPLVENPDPLAKEEKENGKEESKEELSERQKLIDDAIKKHQEEKDIFQQSANATVNAIQKIGRNTGVTIERLPSPGSVMLPLLVLLVFMFLLLPVNGHTRLVWLWLVVTKNASTGGAAMGAATLLTEFGQASAQGTGTGGGPPPSSTGMTFTGNEHPI